ncbi:MAG: hypothetical protein WB767_08445 [Nocardioides sp.]
MQIGRRLLPVVVLATTTLLATSLVTESSVAVSVAVSKSMAGATQGVEPRAAGRVVATDCENLAVTIDLTDAQQARAARLLPRGFRLTEGPTLLVESSTCRTAKVNGKRIGRFSLSESALSIEPPHPITAQAMTERTDENIFMLSQLDTNARLSRFKDRAGYRTEVTRIDIDLGNPLVPRTATASAGGTIAPSRAEAMLTPTALPDGVDVPNPGLVYKLWTRDSRGRAVVTTNSNFDLGRVAVGYGTVFVRPGTTLHRLLGANTASGFALSGSARQFVNETYVFS